MFNITIETEMIHLIDSINFDNFLSDFTFDSSNSHLITLSGGYLNWLPMFSNMHVHIEKRGIRDQSATLLAQVPKGSEFYLKFSPLN
jgi:hypothetical protein